MQTTSGPGQNLEEHHKKTDLVDEAQFSNVIQEVVSDRFEDHHPELMPKYPPTGLIILIQNNLLHHLALTDQTVEKYALLRKL